jgi:peptidoglycan DL-endopeptidase CwlO
LSTQYPIKTFESARDHTDVVAPTLARHANFQRKSRLLGIAVLAVIIPGLLATVALPAYGSASTPSASARMDAALQQRIEAGAQTVYVSAAATGGLKVTRDTIHYIAPRAIVVHHRFTGLVPSHSAARSFAAVKSYGAISITGVAAIAARYLGVPYVFGGESPAGFDCSGLVEFVYAKVGISLPHSSMEQGHMGTRVSVQDARPGDVVVFNGGSHVGIYIGDGHMIDAPYPGRDVSVDKIYSNDYWIVHY